MASQLSTYRYPAPEGLGPFDRGADQTQHRGMKSVGERRDLRVGPIRSQRVLREVVGADREEVGLSGKDADLIRARKLTKNRTGKPVDLGFVGEPWHVEAPILENLMRSDIIPVIAPIGVGEQGETYNINADTVAGAVAAALKASRLLLLTDVVGVLDDKKALVNELTVAEAEAMIAAGTISGGMIPKIETCIDAVEGGVEAAVIIDGRVANAILLELFADRGVGTLIRRRRRGK